MAVDAKDATVRELLADERTSAHVFV